MENGWKLIHKTDRGCRALFIPESVLRHGDRGTGADLAAVAAGAWLAALLGWLTTELAAVICLLCLWGVVRRLEKWKED